MQSMGALPASCSEGTLRALAISSISSYRSYSTWAASIGVCVFHDHGKIRGEHAFGIPNTVRARPPPSWCRMFIGAARIVLYLEEKPLLFHAV
jgi:hypothetical protein